MKNNFRIILAKRFKKISDVIRDTGISRPTLTDLYHERLRNPTAPMLMKIADYLGVTLDELLTVEDDKKKPARQCGP